MLLIPGLRQEDLWDSLASQLLGEFQASERLYLRTTKKKQTHKYPNKAEPTHQAKTIWMAPEGNTHGYLWSPHKHGHTYMSSLVAIDAQTHRDLHTPDFSYREVLLLCPPLFFAAFLAT